MRYEFCLIMKLKLAGNHRFYYLTGEHKMFNVTVAAEFSECEN